jgi:hypothetical protein
MKIVPGAVASLGKGRGGVGAALALVSLLIAPPVALADDAPDMPPEPSASDAPPTSVPTPPHQPPWLDEVRAQRQAWETRRDASRKAMEARRRWIDPWGAAQRESREKEIEQRRQASRERIEQERELLRASRPPFPAYPDTPTLWEPAPPLAAEPPGWNNRWYYEGY